MWNYKNTEIHSIEDIKRIDEAITGFVYLIINKTNNKRYIGKKALFSTRKKKYGKKVIATITDKRLKHYKMVTVESNWVDYKGSNVPLNEDIKSGHIIQKHILHFTKSKLQLTYFETKMLFQYDVLANDTFYNKNITGKFFSNIL